jgi:hypothetical protein
LVGQDLILFLLTSLLLLAAVVVVQDLVAVAVQVVY